MNGGMSGSGKAVLCQWKENNLEILQLPLIMDTVQTNRVLFLVQPPADGIITMESTTCYLKNHIYLINTGSSIYKMQIKNYSEVGGSPVSAIYTFQWKKQAQLIQQFLRSHGDKSNNT